MGTHSLNTTAPEIAFLIFKHLPLRDLISLRLTCRYLSSLTSSIVFRRVRISRLQVDRLAFLAVSKQPHLAPLVREVEWQEISLDRSGTIRGLGLQHFTFGSLREPDDGELDGLLREASDTCEPPECWLPTLNYVYVNDRESARKEEMKREDAVRDFLPMFLEAMDRLVNVDTFISRQMPPDRVVGRPGNYPMLAQFFHGLGGVGAPFLSRPVAWTSRGNDGLMLFFLPEMRRPESRITRLCWQDEGPHDRSGSYVRLTPDCIPSFEKLKSLEVCFRAGDFITALSGSEHAAVAGRCLFASDKLERLSLCFDHNEFQDRLSTNEIVFHKGLLGGVALDKLRSLRSLNLVGFPIEQRFLDRSEPVHDPRHQEVLESIVRLIGNNVDTLSHLNFINCHVTLGFLKRLWGFRNLQQSVMWIDQEPEDGSKTYCEYNVDALENGPRQDFEKDREDRSGDNEIIHNNKPWQPRNGWYQNSDFVPEEWSDGSMCEYLRPPWLPCHVEMDPLPDDRESVSSVETTPSFCSEEPPCWGWGWFLVGTDEKPRFFYWQDDEGTPTKVWKFTRLPGQTRGCLVLGTQVGFGAEPLSYFEDWGECEGDMAEATPLCRDFIDCRRDQSFPGVRGVEVVPDGWMEWRDPDFDAVIYWA